MPLFIITSSFGFCSPRSKSVCYAQLFRQHRCRGYWCQAKNEVQFIIKKRFKLFKHVSVCRLTISPIYQGPSKTDFSIPWGSVSRHPPTQAGAEFPPRHKRSPGAPPRLLQLLQKALPSPPLPTDAVISAVQSPSSFHPSTLSSRRELNSP